MPEVSSRQVGAITSSRAAARARAGRDCPAPALVDQVPWDAPGAVEIAFNIPPRYNASEVLFQNLKRGRGERPAAVGPAGIRSFSDLCAEANRWGNALLSLGLTRGDRVLLFLDDTPIYPAAFFGAVRAGLVPLLINFLTPPDLLRYYLCDAAAKVAIAEAGFCDRFAAAGRAETPLQTLIVVNGEPGSDIGMQTRRAASWLPTFSTELAAAGTYREDMAFWMYSSGSTGRPKGIVHLQHDMAYTARSYATHVLKLTPDDICFSVPKIFFSYGFGNSITFPYCAGAASLLLPGQPKAEAIFAAIARFRPTVFFGLPTLYTALTKAPGIEHADFSSLRLAVSAAEILSADVFNAWKAMTGIEIVEGLGSTEALNVYLSNTPQKKKLGAAGMRIPGYELLLKDQEGNEVPENTEGILWVRGHSNTPGYWNAPDKTKETIRDGGWICTGDRFVCDEDRFYFFRGRADDLVKISGQWVHPLEVQLCLTEHPRVRECAVMAIELPDRRMRLEAFVALNDDAFDAQQATRTLQEHVKQKLLPHKYPRVIHFLPELPKTGTGKIDRQALLQRAAADIASDLAIRQTRKQASSVDSTVNLDPASARRRNAMKLAYRRHLQPARSDIASCAIVCLDLPSSHPGHGAQLLAGFAGKDMSELASQLFMHWLSDHFGREFIESSARGDGSLAFEALRDKLNHNFLKGSGLVALIGCCGGNSDDPARSFRPVAQIEQITLKAHGLARAILNQNAGRAQVILDGLPGSIELTGTAQLPASSSTSRPCARRSRWTEARVWFGFGSIRTSPADIVERLSHSFSEAVPHMPSGAASALAEAVLARSPAGRATRRESAIPARG